MMPNILVFSGAGISKESGVPTFNELGDSFRDGLSRERFNRDPEGFYKDVLMMKDACDAAQPNEAHLYIGRHQISTITMNIDGLHLRGGLHPENLIEVHGHIRTVMCPECLEVYPFDQVRASIYCPKCNELLQHYTILYGDNIPELDRALLWAKRCDILVVVGTSFYTSTSSYIYEEAMSRGKDVHIIDSDAATRLPNLLKGLR